MACDDTSSHDVVSSKHEPDVKRPSAALSNLARPLEIADGRYHKRVAGGEHAQNDDAVLEQSRCVGRVVAGESRGAKGPLLSPVGPNDGETGRAKNRRVELVKQ